MEDGVNAMLLETSYNILGKSKIAVEEGEVSPALKHASVVQGAAIIKLVERHNIVCIRVSNDKMSDKPAGSTIDVQLSNILDALRLT